jgi:DNA polymerase I
MSLRIILNKRTAYNELKKAASATDNQKLKAIYDARQSVLKWILVTSFGYLGFNNAKFGRIDAHIAVCAFDRHILLRAAKVAENHGFRVLHGIVDSLWIKKKRDDDNYNGAVKTKKKQDYLKLKESIERETGFTVSFEGVYKWTAFDNSKRNSELPVANRYFGAFECDKDDDDDNPKVRGIEARRHDTPIFLSNSKVKYWQ